MKTALLSGVISFIAGGLYALAYPSELGAGWFPLLFIALPLFFWKLEAASSLKQSAFVILCYNLGLDIVGYYWIPNTLMEFGQLPFLVALLLGMLFSLILQPHWWLYLLWKQYRPKWQWDSERGILVTAFIMTVLERYFPQQFPSYVGSPWLHLAPYLGLTPYLGVVAFSFVTFWLSLEALAQLKSRKFRPQVWIVFVLFVVVNALIPLQNPAKKDELKVRFVQANIGNFLKIQSEYGDGNSYEAVRKKYLNLSTVENGFNPDLIIWPETAYPDAFFGEETLVNELFHRIISQTKAELLIGGYDQDTSKASMDIIESVFNASILISDGKVKSSYHKNILIPFGETLPFGPFNRQIVSIVPAVSLFARGDGTPLMETKQKFRFVTPICYEILESNYMRGLLNQWKDNHFIVNHTNDSWYGDTAEPYQHLFLSKWRALEFQLPILRSTNTGITSVIYPDGTESKRLGIGQDTFLDVNLPISAPQNTFYQLYGALPMLAIFLLIFLATWIRHFFQVKTESRP
ncbi:MAG TPA: apolipoprotein N-acyltransferase [Bacteriovoracaceae bacterium]|nr:apolipoprotein N-acyltransferase [Bacteriovoracaceae bacterium]